jgi:hypothetical protein
LTQLEATQKHVKETFDGNRSTGFHGNPSAHDPIVSARMMTDVLNAAANND